jgi:serine/threonine protein phosphatase PrpC
MGNSERKGLIIGVFDGNGGRDTAELAAKEIESALGEQIGTHHQDQLAKKGGGWRNLFSK